MSFVSTLLQRPLYSKLKLKPGAWGHRLWSVITPFHSTTDATGNYELSRHSTEKLGHDNRGFSQVYTRSGFNPNYTNVTRRVGTSLLSSGIGWTYLAVLRPYYFHASSRVIGGVGFNSSGFLHIYSGSLRHTSTNSVSSGEYSVVVAWGESGDSNNCILNGTESGTVDGGFGNQPDPPIVGGQAGFGCSDDHIYLVASWARQLSARERWALADNPWQIFVQNVRQRRFHEAAGGGFEPAWARPRSQTIGTGVH